MLVEPTSAVDAHTEARIARPAARGARRAGRRSIVTSSPLVLDQADRVVYVHEGRVVAEGSHRELLRARPDYREVVTRGEDAVSDLLPIADGPELRAAGEAARAPAPHGADRHGRCCTASAAATGLAGPPLLGRPRAVGAGRHDGGARRQMVVPALRRFLLAQTALTLFARRASFVLSEQMFAELREDFMRPRARAAALDRRARRHRRPRLAHDRRRRRADAHDPLRACRRRLIAAITAVLTVAAAIWVSPLAALPCIAGVPALWFGTRWYLKRAPAGLPVGARHVRDAGRHRRRDGRRRPHARGARPERAAGAPDRRRPRRVVPRRAAHALPAHDLVPDGRVRLRPPRRGRARLGRLARLRTGTRRSAQVTAVSLYVVQLADPVDRLISWLDEIQVGATSFARLVGIARVPPDRTATDETPDDEHLIAQDVRYAYVDDRDVLHGIDLDLKPGERVAVVGPSGAGKSTLGRLLAGIHPPRVGPRRRRRRPPRRPAARHAAQGGRARHAGAARLRRHPRREPEACAAGRERRAAARRADGRRRDRLGRRAAGGRRHRRRRGRLSADARAGAAARARAARARRPAHARARRGDVAARPARGAPPRALARVRARGRTVVAIAHRLHTAHDADRVAVVEDGLLEEIGTHDELVERGGSYAALWDSWHSER